MSNDIELDKDMGIDEDEVEALEQAYKDEVFSTIEAFGGLDAAKEIVQRTGDPFSQKILVRSFDGLMEIPVFKLQELITGYLLLGLDNPLKLTNEILEAMKKEIEKTLEEYDSIFKESGHFESATILMEVKLKSGRVLSYGLRELDHMIGLNNSTKQSKGLEL